AGAGVQGEAAGEGARGDGVGVRRGAAGSHKGRTVGYSDLAGAGDASDGDSRRRDDDGAVGALGRGLTTSGVGGGDGEVEGAGGGRGAGDGAGGGVQGQAGGESARGDGVGVRRGAAAGHE